MGKTESKVKESPITTTGCRKHRTNIVNRVGIFGWPNNYITMEMTFEYLLTSGDPQHKLLHMNII